MRHGVETLRWLWTAFTQAQPAELAALPQPEARADRIALLGLALVNVVVLLLALASAHSHAPRQAPAAPERAGSAEAAWMVPPADKKNDRDAQEGRRGARTIVLAHVDSMCGVEVLRRRSYVVVGFVYFGAPLGRLGSPQA